MVVTVNTVTVNLNNNIDLQQSMNNVVVVLLSNEIMLLVIARKTLKIGMNSYA